MWHGERAPHASRRPALRAGWTDGEKFAHGAAASVGVIGDARLPIRTECGILLPQVRAIALELEGMARLYAQSALGFLVVDQVAAVLGAYFMIALAASRQ